MPTPKPIFSPVSEVEAGGVAEVDCEAGVEAIVDGDDAVLLVCAVVLDTPIVAARTTRFFIAQQASEVRSPPQHQVPSTEHCDIAALSLALPPV